MIKLIFLNLIFSLRLIAQDDRDLPAGSRRQRVDASEPMSWAEQQYSESRFQDSSAQALDPRTQRRVERDQAQRERGEIWRAFPVTIASLNVYQRLDEHGDEHNVISVVIPGATEEMDRFFNRSIDLSNVELIDYHLDIFVREIASRFRGQNVTRYVMSSTDSIYQVLRNVRQGLVALQSNRLSEQIFERGGARIYRLFVGVHQNNLRDLTRMLITALGGTSNLGLHSGSGAQTASSGSILELGATPSTRRERGSPRSISRLENLSLVFQSQASEVEHDFRSGIYVITGETADLNNLTIIDLHHQRISDQQIEFIYRFWNHNLNPILRRGFRYIGQVGVGPDGTRTIIDRVPEHQMAPIENPLNRRNLGLMEMNNDGEEAQFHALAYNVHPDDLNVVEALGILIARAATAQSGGNSNVGNRQALERVRNAIRVHNAQSSSETSLELGEQTREQSPVPMVPSPSVAQRRLSFGVTSGASSR